MRLWLECDLDRLRGVEPPHAARVLRFAVDILGVAGLTSLAPPHARLRWPRVDWNSFPILRSRIRSNGRYRSLIRRVVVPIGLHNASRPRKRTSLPSRARNKGSPCSGRNEIAGHPDAESRGRHRTQSERFRDGAHRNCGTPHGHPTFRHPRIDVDVCPRDGAMEAGGKQQRTDDGKKHVVDSFPLSLEDV